MAEENKQVPKDLLPGDKQNKPIYKNYKTGKYYTLHEVAGEEKPALFTVFIDDAKYDNAPKLVDKTGRAYVVLEVTLKCTKNGFMVFRG